MLAFVDTGAWVALHVRHEARHPEVLAFFRDPGRGTRLVTSNLMVAETATWLQYRAPAGAAIRFKEQVARSERAGLIRVEWVTP